MTTIAQGDQVFVHVVAQGASSADVVDFQKVRTSAPLTSPAIALEHFFAEVSIGSSVDPDQEQPFEEAVAILSKRALC